MTIEERKVPELRFKGFFEDWEQRKLGKELSLLKDGTHGSHVNVNDGPYLLSAKNIKNGKIQITENDRKISNEEFQKIHRNFELKSGDILLTIVGSIGESAILYEPTGITFQRSVAYLRSSTINSLFLYTLLKSPNFQKELISKKVVSAQPGIYLGDLRKIQIIVSKNPEEQKIIGNFIKSLEKHIELHQRKIQKLSRIKSQYLHKMFPKEGKNEPELRFNNFGEAWEQRELHTVYNVSMGHSPKSENYTSNPNDYILVQGNADILNGWVSPRVWTTQITNLAQAGSVLISVRAPVGNVGKTAQDVVIGRGIAAIEGEEFIFQQLNKMHLEKYWKKFSTGSTFESINSKDIKEALIELPDKTERDRIGMFLKNLDDIINLHQSKLDRLLKIKQIYLNKMFI